MHIRSAIVHQILVSVPALDTPATPAPHLPRRTQRLWLRGRADRKLLALIDDTTILPRNRKCHDAARDNVAGLGDGLPRYGETFKSADGD